jgi:hypothetical protein
LLNKLVTIFIKYLRIIKGEKQGGLAILEDPRGGKTRMADLRTGNGGRIDETGSA